MPAAATGVATEVSREAEEEVGWRRVAATAVAWD